MALERGSLLNNRYRIVEILGQGGMGSVYRAVDENLGVDVAVKDNLFTTEEYARQFRREAVILANLRHPNLPRVTDHFVIEGHGQYLVMDYIEGEDLRQRMDRVGLISEEESIIIGAAICDALDFLGSRNPPIVHRDIKPGNVKITPQGQIYLVDFGLAKVLQHGAQATTTGARAMTPGYSPPEQYGTARTDHRSDIFSLGATLYAAMTGAIPEDALSRAMDQTELTSVRKHNPKVSRRMASVIEKSLGVRPDDRFQSAEEFKQALLSVRTVPRRKTGEYTVAPPPSTESRPIPATDEDLDPSPMAPMQAMPRSPSRSPLPVSTPIDYEGERKPRAAGARGGGRSCWLTVVILLILVAASALVVYAADPGLAAWALSFVRPPVTAEVTAPAAGVVESSPTPDFVRRTTPSATFAPLIIDPTSSAAPSTPTAQPRPTRTSAPTETPLPQPTAMGGGQGQIAFASDRSGKNQIYITGASDSEVEVFQVTDMLEGACQPSWSPDGQRIVFTSPCEGNLKSYPNSGLFVINADGTNLMPLLNQSGGDFDPAWSPDGKYVAFTSLRNFGRPQIFVYSFEDNTAVGLSATYSWNFQPAWSADSKKLAYVNALNGRDVIWTMDLDGENKELFSRNNYQINNAPSWAPDGTTIIYTQLAADQGVPKLVGAAFPWDSSTGEYRKSPSQLPMREGVYSPDGFWVAFEGWPKGANHDIYLIASNGAGLIRVTAHERLDFDPAWRPVVPPS